ncbi:MAG: hypothetical protein LBQ54_08670 [Planctomycetaceae bacterium]|nr:hypothetical protein [Planctomycetaceae bacterium]
MPCRIQHHHAAQFFKLHAPTSNGNTPGTLHGNARALYPGLLTLTAFGSPSDRKIFPTDNCGEAARFPAANGSGFMAFGTV